MREALLCPGANGIPQRRLPIPTEIELKLAVQAADLPALKRTLIEMAPDRVSARKRLLSTYYDTPDRALQRRGLILRIREQGGRFIQTVKAGDLMGPDILARGEWEDAVDENRPNPHAPESGAQLPDGATSDLRPLFVTDITRTAVGIEPEPATQIEAAIDEGEIRVIGGREVEPISEVELELKGGEPAMIYDLAARLLDVAPMRIGMRAKSDRGYQLVDGADAAPRAVHAEPVSLDPTISVGDALQAIGRGCLRQLLRNEAAALSAQPEGIHQMRIAVRRLRSALSSFKKMLPAEDLAWITGELKWLMSALAEARNLDAFGTDLLEPTRDALHDEPGFDDLAAAVDRLRRAAYERVREVILSERYTALMLHLLHWFEARSWRGRSPFDGSDSASQPIGEVTPLLLDRRRRKMRQRSKHFGRLNSRKRHKLRIAGKKLRYAIELLESLFNQQDLQKFTKRLKRLQDDLGHANDVSVAHDFLRRLCRNAQFDSPVANAGARLLEWHERAMAKGERKLRKRLRRLNHAKPFWRARPPR